MLFQVTIDNTGMTMSLSKETQEKMMMNTMKPGYTGLERFETTVKEAADQAATDLMQHLGMLPALGENAGLPAQQRVEGNTALYDAFLSALDLDTHGPADTDASMNFGPVLPSDEVMQSALAALLPPAAPGQTQGELPPLPYFGTTPPPSNYSTGTQSSPSISSPEVSTPASSFGGLSPVPKKASEEQLMQEYLRQELRQKRTYTGTRNTSIPLVDESAPIAPRKYLTPSATARKRAASPYPESEAKTPRTPGGGDLTPEELEAIEAKRRQNTVAARRSRLRKQQHLQALEEENQRLRDRVARLEAELAVR